VPPLELDLTELFDQHRSPQGLHKESKSNKKYFDLFSSKSELSLNGHWRIKSVFGGLLTLGLIICVLLMSTYMMNQFSSTRARTISHSKSIVSDTVN
jgi:hypothetical protein